MSKQTFFFFYAFVIAFSTFSGIFRFTNVGSIIYLVAIFSFFLISTIFARDKKKIHIGSWAICGFVFICIVSIVLNQPPSYFRVWERLALFVNVLMAFSPVLISKRLNQNRVYLFDGLLKVMIFFATVSFIAYFLGINYFVRNGELLDYTEAGHFSGLTNHSMALAPISSIAAIFGLTKALSINKKGRNGYIWWTITFMCYGSVLLSASRGALGGVMLATAVTVYRFNMGKIGGVLKYCILGIALLSLTFPLWGGLTESVKEKNDYNISQGGVAYSRESKMAARMYEIKNNFFTGVGFSVVDETVDSVNRLTGTIEPNSSWLGVFSMTGVIGFLIFLGINVRAFMTAYRKIPDKSVATLLCGILAFFFVHMMIEGYVLAGGSFFCGTYWLTLGVVYANTNQYKIELYQKNI